MWVSYSVTNSSFLHRNNVKAGNLAGNSFREKKLNFYVKCKNKTNNIKITIHTTITIIATKFCKIFKFSLVPGIHLTNKQGCGPGLIQAGSSILAQSGSRSRNGRHFFLTFLKYKFKAKDTGTVPVLFINFYIGTGIKYR
jgi:hypothetical protein